MKRWMIFVMLMCAVMAACFSLTQERAALAEEAAPKATPVPARGYVLVTVGEQSRWFALPDSEEYSITVRQVNHDTGEEMINTITFTPNGVYMRESTCDNQDCVDQGEVTLDNRHERILTNMVICLPNQVSIELYTPEELLAMMGGAQ